MTFPSRIKSVGENGIAREARERRPESCVKPISGRGQVRRGALTERAAHLKGAACGRAAAGDDAQFDSIRAATGLRFPMRRENRRARAVSGSSLQSTRSGEQSGQPVILDDKRAGSVCTRRNVKLGARDR